MTATPTPERREPCPIINNGQPCTKQRGHLHLGQPCESAAASSVPDPQTPEDEAEIAAKVERWREVWGTRPAAPVSTGGGITDEMVRQAETHHGDSCSYCNSAGDIDCPTAAILDELVPARPVSTGERPALFRWQDRSLPRVIRAEVGPMAVVCEMDEWDAPERWRLARVDELTPWPATATPSPGETT